ncbi:MAG: hypothetical protein L6R41_007640 [Letrouitia leprolyta]|nr:MAG: hypothetical protein L6R41_007640 [Letrouitia leprolyta]
MKILLAVGACYLDTVLNVDHYPAEDSKLRASRIIRRRGGNCPNTLEVLQQLLDSNPRDSPISLALCAVLPSSSSLGYREIKSSFEEATDLTPCICREDSTEPASSYIIRSKAADSRTIVNYNGLREMMVEEFAGVVDTSREGLGWCHFEGRIPDVTLACIRYLRQRHPTVKISVELEKPGREGLQDLATLADVVFYSKSWAGNGYQTSEECLRSQAILTFSASLLLCTWGEFGATALELPSHNIMECAAFKEEGHRAIDTVGAGDTFIAGMLFGLTCHPDDWHLNRKLGFANEVAGRKVVQEGLRGLGCLMKHSF